MAFDLTITFTGLCFFAYHKEGVHVLMPDSDKPIPKELAPSGESPNAADTLAPTEHEGEHDHGVDHHHQTTLWYNSGYHDGTGLNAQLVFTDLENRFLVLDKAAPGAVKLPDEIVDLVKHLEYGKVIASLVDNSSLPEALDSRVSLKGGALTSGPSADWEIETKLTSRPVQRKLTFRAEWKATYQTTTLELEFKNREGKVILSRTLTPIGDKIDLEVTCLPACEPPRGNADHFAFYGLLVDDGKHLPKHKRPRFKGKFSDQKVNRRSTNGVNWSANAVTCMVAGGPVG